MDRLHQATRVTENREEILKIYGEIKLIKTLLDNHVSHISKRIDTIYKIIWAVSFMALGNLMWVVRSLMN
jgi:DNA-directed RNA polymerase delta subunit